MTGTASATRFTWSAARLQSLLQCPRQFRYAVVDGIPAIPTAPRVFGSVMHETLAWAGEQQLMSGELPSVEDMEARLRALWGTALEEQTLFVGPRHLRLDEYPLAGTEMLSAFYRDYARQAPPLAVNLVFDVTFNGHRLVGTIDRVEDTGDGVVLVDYKGGQKKPSPAQAASDLQLTIWALALQLGAGWSVERVSYRFLRDGRLISSLRDESDLQAVVLEVLPRAAQQLERQDFSPTPGYWCRFCDYRELCAAETMRCGANSPPPIRSLAEFIESHDRGDFWHCGPGVGHNSNGADGVTNEASGLGGEPLSAGQERALRLLLGCTGQSEAHIQESLSEQFGVAEVESLTASQANGWLLDLQRSERERALHCP